MNAGDPTVSGAGWKFLREKGVVLNDVPKPVPPEFVDHTQYITDLVDQIADIGLRIRLLEAIETLVHGMNGSWQGARVGWQWGSVPDNLASLFDQEP